MELVPEDLLDNIKHTGGRAAMPGQLGEVTPGGSLTPGERLIESLGPFGGTAPGESEGSS